MKTHVPTSITRREAIWVALALLALAALALRPSIRGNDGYGNYVYLASLLRGGDLDFADEYAAIDVREDYAFKLARLPLDPRTGLPSNRYGVGAALLWSPFVMLAHGALKLAQPAAAMGFGRAYEWGVGVGTAFWGSLGLWLLYRRLRQSAPGWAAGWTLAALIFASPLGFYLYAHGSMSHGVSFFAAVGLMLSFELAWHRPGLRAVVACAAWCSLLVMIRAQDATWALLAGAALAGRTLRREQLPPRARVVALAAGLAVGIAVFVPQLIAWHLLSGSALAGPAPYLNASAGSFSLWSAHLPHALFSARHGLLVWHPLFAIALLGCFLEARRYDPDNMLARFALVGFALQAWLVGCWSIWWAGASFGNRFFISALPFLAVGMAQWFSRATTRATRLSIALGLTLLCVWNTGLLAQYAAGMIPREDAVSWRRVLHQNFVEVPALILHKARP